jgi:hypothetical protein
LIRKRSFAATALIKSHCRVHCAAFSAVYEFRVVVALLTATLHHSPDAGGTSGYAVGRIHVHLRRDPRAAAATRCNDRARAAVPGLTPAGLAASTACIWAVLGVVCKDGEGDNGSAQAFSSSTPFMRNEPAILIVSERFRRFVAGRLLTSRELRPRLRRRLR